MASDDRAVDIVRVVQSGKRSRYETYPRHLGHGVKDRADPAEAGKEMRLGDAVHAP